MTTWTVKFRVMGTHETAVWPRSWVKQRRAVAPWW